MGRDWTRGWAATPRGYQEPQVLVGALNVPVRVRPPADNGDATVEIAIEVVPDRTKLTDDDLEEVRATVELLLEQLPEVK
jgi:hypothetical protein